MKLLWFLFLLGVTCVARAQDSEPLPPAHPAPPYFRSILEGGALYIGLHILIVATFVWSLSTAARRRFSARTLISCGLPFALGSVAMWLRSYGLIIASRLPLYEGDIYSALRAIPYAFYFGAACSALALLFLGILYAFNRNA